MVMNLKAAREHAGMTQQQVAEAVGASLYSVRKWEQGRNEPDASMLCALADLYGCTTDTLLGTRFADLGSIGIAAHATAQGDRLSDDEERLVEIFRSASPSARVSILAAAQGIASAHPSAKTDSPHGAEAMSA